ncbi:MAG: LacI family DNA-binding transcriptional regulator [Opitutaceae bacterium]
MNRITLADVAKRAGVHASTVSMALRNHPSLPAATKDRLRSMAKAMGYVPDPALSALAAYRRMSARKPEGERLAYVTDWFSSEGWKEMPAHAEFFEGAAEKSRELGYRLEHHWLGEHGMSAARLGSILLNRGIVGLILASQRLIPGISFDFDWPRFSAIKIDYFPAEPPIHCVSNDQRAIVQMATQKALAAGYRRIGLVLERQFDLSAREAWSAGFLAELQRLKASDRVPILHFSNDQANLSGLSDENQPIGRRRFAPWYAKHRPEVVIGYGRHVRPSVEETGLNIPGEVAFVELFLEDSTGATAGVRENCRRVGEVAVEELVGQLHQNLRGLPRFPTCTLVEGTWVDGASLPPLPGSRTAPCPSRAQPAGAAAGADA